MALLAIKGGRPTREEPFMEWPVFDEREIDAVVKVVKSGKWWRFAYAKGVELSEDTSGIDRSKVIEFQEQFANYHGAKRGIALANGTAALEVILKALGVGPGDEVIVPAYTYIATASCILQNNAIPIFVDIDADTYNLDPQRLEAKITERTRAIIPVHFGGQCADMDEILRIADKYGIAVVEDAAHAHGAEWKGQKVGTYGIASAFSFQASKNMTAGEGGIILTDSDEVAELCDSYIWAGREKGRPWYEFHRLGWNYRMTELQGAILLVQLLRLEEQNRIRQENAQYLSDCLEEIGGTTPLKVDPRVTSHSYHIYMFKYDSASFNGVSRDRFVNALVAEGIPAFTGYTFPLYQNPMFLEYAFYQKGCPFNCKHYGKTIDYAKYSEECRVSEKACYDEAVWFEHRLLLGTRRDIDHIVDAIKKIKSSADQLL